MMSPSITAYAAKLEKLKRLYGNNVAKAADKVAKNDLSVLDKVMLIVFGIVLILLYKIFN